MAKKGAKFLQFPLYKPVESMYTISNFNFE